MDNTERLVDTYLSSLGLGPVVFEPDGNVPPDFLVDSRIAVEARRLNQNFVLENGKVRGLEEDRIPFWQIAERFIPTIGPSQPMESWYVNLDFRRVPLIHGASSV